LKIPFFTANKNVKLFSKKNKISIEEAGRTLRYRTLNELSDKYSFNKIATGHNLDDNAETVLLNLIKGKGLRAISGIPIRHEKIIRPILCLTKYEIEEYLDINDIAYVKDLSNQSEVFERNYLRLKIVPELVNSLNGNLNSTIFQTSKILEDFISFFDEILDEKYKHLVSIDNDTIILNLKSFKEEKNIIKKEIIRRILLQEIKFEPTFKKINEILNLADLQSGRKITISEKYEVYKDNIALIFSKIGKKNQFDTKIKIGKSYTFNDLTISIKKTKNIKMNKTPNIEIIDSDKVVGELSVRNWQLGDKFFPLGMKRSKKLSDFLTDLKISSYQKEKVLVLTDNEKILSVLGFRIDDRVKISGSSKNFFKIEIKNGK
jgi:tRNA(Ile)-lysidine synthase